MAEVSVSTHVDAPPEVVFALVSDLARMGEWSPECTSVEWKGGATGPALGAAFKGRNRSGRRRWSTDARITTFEPGKALAFDVHVGPLKVARWGYAVAPDPAGGTTLTETWLDQRLGPIATVTGWATGVKDRSTHNRSGMVATLERMKAAAEAASGGTA